MEIFESSLFTKLQADYFTDEEYRAFQTYLILNPEAGDLISGTGGFRKVRWGDAKRGKGKRGGTRIIYYYFDQDNQLWLMLVYNKNEMNDLSAKEKKTLKAAIENELTLRQNSKVKVLKRRK